MIQSFLSRLRQLSIPRPLAAFLGLAGAILLVALAYHFVAEPRAAREAAAKATAAATVSEAQTQAARETIQTIERYHTETQRIETRTEQSSAAIRAAPGADARVDPALARAWRRSLCLHDNRGDDAVCAAVLHGDDPGTQPAVPDVARSGAGG